MRPKIHKQEPLELMDIPRWFIGALALGVIGILIAGKLAHRTWKWWTL